jgi:hypothetical protein
MAFFRIRTIAHQTLKTLYATAIARSSPETMMAILVRANQQRIRVWQPDWGQQQEELLLLICKKIT